MDILALTELNKRWSKVNEENTIWNAMRRWRKEGRTYAAYNRLDQGDTKDLYGGTSVTLFNDVALRKQQHGADPRQLGRWTWATIEGKNNCKTIIISAYCPCKGNGGATTVWAQHLDAMLKWNSELPPEIDDPRKLFWYDLSATVKAATDDGYKVMLLGDFNSDFKDLREWMVKHGLVENICEIHGYDKAPRTHTRSQAAPLDAMFCSPHLIASKGGYLSFSTLGGDHRGLWIDIPNELLFGFNPPSLTMAKARRLQLEDPRVVKKYTDKLHELYKKHQVYDQLNILHRTAIYPPPIGYDRQYERCDNIMQECMMQAEKKCRKFKCGNTDWSPEYQRIHDTIDYWMLRLRYIQGINPNAQMLKRLGKKVKVKYKVLTTTGIKRKLNQAHEDRREFKKRASTASLEYRNQLAKAKEEAGNLEAAQYLRQLNDTEAIRKLFGTIRAVEQKINAGATSQVQITKEDGTTVQYTNKKEIEEALCQVNEAKYHQTEGGSQLLQPDFVELLGRHGEGPEVNKVLNGTFQYPPQTTDATKDFLRACQRPANMTDIPQKDNPVDRFNAFVKSWKIRKERTVSANQHIGHYKACMSHPFLNWSLFLRHEIPTITGYSPDRHRRCVDLSILKRSGNYNIEKQRTLGLLDTEFNHINKITGHEAMRNALEKDCIATEQYSRPRRSAIDHALNRTLTFDHFLYTRSPYCLASCDLKGCYDRIIHTAAALALRRVGVHPQRIQSMFTSIQRMVHKIRTVFGDSTTTYGGDNLDSKWENYPQGVLQGNACGPQIWSILSSTIFDILKTRGFSVKFCTSLSKSLFTLIGFSYVDDCDLLQAAEDTESTLASMQEVINSWSDLMEVTGGEVAASKSWWYFIDFIWERGKWKASDVPGEHSLLLKTKDVHTPLTRLPCNTASEMLGIWMAPNGDQTEMIKHLRSEALKWADKIKAGHPSPAVAWTALHKTISAKLKYCLPICRFTKDDCKYIMAPVIAIGLQKSGIARNFPTAARHAPILTGGLNALHMYYEMGVARITALVEHCANDTPTGHFMKLNMEHLILETGLYGSLWEMPFDKYTKWATQSSWIHHTCEFLSDNQIKLNIPHSTLQPQRKNDQSIMSLATQYSTSTTTLRAINRVRMLHEVVHLSDITTANGKTLDTAFLISDPFPEKRNDLVWPAQHHVSTTDFTEWRQFMNYVFGNDKFTLHKPLGPWIHTMEPTDQIYWHWFLSADKKNLYERINNAFAIHSMVPHDRKNFQYKTTMTNTIPSNVRPASVELHKKHIHLVNTGPTTKKLQSHLEDQPTFTRHHIYKLLTNKLPPWCSQRIRTSKSLSYLRQELILGKAKLVSDGSYYERTGQAGAGWIISTQDCQEFICGGGAIPGPSDRGDSYRSEVAGLIGSSAALSLLLPLLPIHASTYTIGCDNKAAIGHLKATKPVFKSKWNHSDLTSTLLQIWEDMPITPTAVHIKGHRDDHYGPHTALETMNIHMDHLAKACAKSFKPIHRHNNPWHSKGLGAIYIKDTLVCGKVKETLYESLCHNDFTEYLEKKWTLPKNTLSKPDWKIFARARRLATHDRRIFISKWLVDQLPTGLRMVKRKQRISAKCPHCPAEEDTLHMPTCPDTAVRNFWHTSIQSLHAWLESIDTDPTITDFLCNGITSWTQNPFGEELPLLHFPPPFITAFQNQLDIGWFGTLSGLLHPSLISLQQQHYSAIQSRRTGSAWGRRLTSKLWQHIHDLWMLRNRTLHDNPIQSSQGEDHLNFAIKVEHLTGPIGLPKHYSDFFRVPLATLLLKPLAQRKQWFRLIRHAREIQKLPIHDAFTTNVILRNWVHLPNNKA